MTWVLIVLGSAAGIAAAARGFNRVRLPAEPPPVDLSVQLARLRRLQALRAEEQQAGGVRYLAARRTVNALAYDALIVECAHRLGIEAPALPLTHPLPAQEELALEVELAARGLSW